MTDTDPDPVPPHISFGTMLNQVDRMGRDGVPSRIDKHYLVGMAGGTRAHFKQALRSLGLIDVTDRPTRTLIALAEQPERRKELFAELLRDRYPRLAALELNASKSDVLEVLQGYGINSADTLRKSLTFYVGLAEYAGLPVSPHIKPAGRATRVPAGPRRSTRRAAKAAPKVDDQQNGSGDTYTVSLGSGGQVSVVVDVNLFDLTTDDRNFVIDLVDKLKGYAVVDGQATTKERAS